MRGMWVGLAVVLLAALVAGTLVRASGSPGETYPGLPGGPPSMTPDGIAYYTWLAQVRKSDPALGSAYIKACIAVPLERKRQGLPPLSFDGFRAVAWATASSGEHRPAG